MERNASLKAAFPLWNSGRGRTSSVQVRDIRGDVLNPNTLFLLLGTKNDVTKKAKEYTSSIGEESKATAALQYFPLLLSNFPIYINSF